MKNVLIAIFVAIFVVGIGFWIWGYLKGQEIKKQGQQLEQITSDTLKLATVNSDSFEISLSEWKNLSEKAPSIIDQFETISAASDLLKEKANRFYGAQSQDKYREAQYLQILLNGQRTMDLKNTQSKSKGQIESALKQLEEFQNSLSDLSLGPEFNEELAKLNQESSTFKESITRLNEQMSYSSSSVQLDSAGLDKAIDELKQALIKTLNDFVDLQNSIRDEIQKMSSTKWFNPLTK